MATILYSIEIPPQSRSHEQHMSPQDMKRELALALFRKKKYPVVKRVKWPA
jgi:hypothetical protein